MATEREAHRSHSPAIRNFLPGSYERSEFPGKRYVTNERTLSVYQGLTAKYAWTVLGAVVGHCLISMTIAYTSSYFLTDHVAQFSPVCTSPSATPWWYSMYHTQLPTFGGTMSVLIYIGVVVAYRHKSAHSTAGSSAQQKRQAKLTKTMAVVTSVTFFCHMIPSTVITCFTIFDRKSETFALIGPYMWSVIMFNSLVNVFIYITRMKNIRDAMFAIICCKSESAQVRDLTMGGGSTVVTNKSGPAMRRKSVIPEEDIDEEDL